MSKIRIVQSNLQFLNYDLDKRMDFDRNFLSIREISELLTAEGPILG